MSEQAHSPPQTTTTYTYIIPPGNHENFQEPPLGDSVESPKSKKKKRISVTKTGKSDGGLHQNVGKNIHARMTMGVDKDLQQEMTRDRHALNTEYNNVIVGSYSELQELKKAPKMPKDDEDFEKHFHAINANIFYWTKWGTTIFLTLLGGPVMAIIWGITISVAKFGVSWGVYPAVKVVWILVRPLRSMIKVLTMPLEPVFELFARMWPTVHFSLATVHDAEEAEMLSLTEENRDLEAMY
jgi:hypothetical protein